MCDPPPLGFGHLQQMSTHGIEAMMAASRPSASSAFS